MPGVCSPSRRVVSKNFTMRGMGSPPSDREAEPAVDGVLPLRTDRPPVGGSRRMNSRLKAPAAPRNPPTRVGERAGWRGQAPLASPYSIDERKLIKPTVRVPRVVERLGLGGERERAEG